ncbi:hypothetical protein BGX21_008626 [Mortierella sp. AD011]|nr:hypothetical protein BGX20_001164 [Mortierella sp. AD010]KAF9397664.1 hypothetical protein BGX21_008626 [Mortierella sp. AD011]
MFWNFFTYLFGGSHHEEERIEQEQEEDFREKREQYNILLLGETQSGKSTLVQAIKRYADPMHDIEHELLGSGITSCTSEIRQHIIETDFPEYEVSQTVKSGPMGRATEELIDTTFFDNIGKDVYEEKLNLFRQLRMYRCNRPGRRHYRFNIFDTPGLNDTYGQDESHIYKILQVMSLAQHIDLVIITIREAAFTPQYQNVLQTYFHVFPELKDNVVFVHTKADYVDLHPLAEKSRLNREERDRKIHAIMERERCTHFRIDCDLDTNKLVRVCMTQHVIKEILDLATFNKPVIWRSRTMRKTPRMREIDHAVAEILYKMSEVTEATLRYKDSTGADIYGKRRELAKKFIENQIKQDDVRSYISERDSDHSILLYERNFDQAWKLFDFFRSDNIMSYPAQIATITDLNIRQEHVVKKEEVGGTGYTYYEVKFQREMYKNGIFHVRIFGKSSDVYQEMIDAQNFELERLKYEYQGLVEERNEYESTLCDGQEDILQELDYKRELYETVILHLSADVVCREIFEKLLRMDAYSPLNRNSTKIVQGIYMGHFVGCV